MASIYRDPKSPSFYYKFMFRGKQHRGSTGERSKAKAEAVMRQKIAEVRGEISLSEQFNRVVLALDALPAGEQDKLRQEFSDRLITSMTSRLLISDALSTWERMPRNQDVCRQTKMQNAKHWGRFTAWMSEHHRRVQCMFRNVLLSLALDNDLHLFVGTLFGHL